MKAREFEVMAPGLGLNTMMNDMQIKDQEASDLLNIEFVENGCPAKRRGTSQVGDVISNTRTTLISTTTNLITNPSFETNTTGWTKAGTGGSIARDTTTGYIGSACLKLTTAASGNQQATFNLTGLSIGQQYTVQARIKATAAGKAMYCQTGFSGYAGYVGINSTGDWDLVTLTSTATATSGTVEFGVFSNSDYILIDAVMAETGSTASSYFDGSSTDTITHDYSWTGTAHASTSTDALYNDVVNKIKGMSPLNYQSGSSIVREILQMSGTSLKKLSNNVWTAISGVTFTRDLNTNFTQARNALYVHNATDNMAKYDGSALTQPATGVIAGFGIFYSGYHICAGNPSNPSRLYISNPLNASDFTGSSGTASAGGNTTLTDSTKAWGTNDFANQKLVITAGTGAGQSRTIVSNTDTILTIGTAWQTNPDSTSQYTIASGNYVDISKDDGDKITGMGKWQDSLIVFKERSTYQFTFDATGVPTVKPVNIGVGCVAHRSIINVENDLFFLSRKGVYVLGNEPNYLNTIRTNELSGRVASEIQLVTPANLGECSAVYYDYKYMLSIPQGGTTYNNTVLVYDRRFTSWSKWTGINPNSFAIYIDPNNAEHVYFADDNSGTVWELFVGLNDGGTAISAQWTSKAFTFKENDRTKRWDAIRHYFRKVYGNIQIDLIIDGDTIPKTVSLGSSNSSSRGIGTDLIGKTIIAQDGSTGTVSVGLTSETEPIETKLKKKGRTLKIKYSNNNLSETFTLLGFKPKAKIMGSSNFPSSRRF